MGPEKLQQKYQRRGSNSLQVTSSIYLKRREGLEKPGPLNSCSLVFLYPGFGVIFLTTALQTLERRLVWPRPCSKQRAPCEESDPSKVLQLRHTLIPGVLGPQQWQHPVLLSPRKQQSSSGRPSPSPCSCSPLIN